MGDKLLLALILSIFFLPLSSAVIINEFTVDPQTDWDNSGSATSGDEFIELYNPSNSSVDLTNWTLVLNDSSEETEILSGSIPALGYIIILDPSGTQNNDGQLQLFNALGVLQDSVTYGSFDDGNVTNNAPDGNAGSASDECLSRIPNSVDSGIDSQDFQKTKCTFQLENGVLQPNEQGLNATILGKIILSILPRFIDFGPIQPGSTNNPSLNGDISLDATGSTTDVFVEITNIIGPPFDTGLKINNAPAINQSWSLPTANQIQTATPTLDVPADFPAGQVQGTIVYTITGPTP